MGVAMFKIEGLDELQKSLKKMQRVAEELDGDLGTISFNPEDPESIAHAIIAMERLVDERFSGTGGTMLGSIAEEMKEAYRTAILEKAAEARVEVEE
jgi:hypothetical protein